MSTVKPMLLSSICQRDVQWDTAAGGTAPSTPDKPLRNAWLIFRLRGCREGKAAVRQKIFRITFREKKRQLHIMVSQMNWLTS